MKLIVTSLALSFSLLTAAYTHSMYNAHLEYLHAVVDSLEEKIFCDTVSIIDHERYVSDEGTYFSIKFVQKPRLVVGGEVRHVYRNASVRDMNGNLVFERIYVVDAPVKKKTTALTVIDMVVKPLCYIACWKIGLDYILSDCQFREFNSVAAVGLGAFTGLALAGQSRCA